MFSRFKKDFLRVYLPFVILIILFIGVSSIISPYSESIQNIIAQNNIFAVFIYILVLTTAIVIAPLPINTILLIPIAVSAWGSFFAAILSIGAWIMGAMIAFWLARAYGRPVVSKFVSLKKIEAFEKRISKKHLFWTVVALRVAFPTDIISYALGMFTKMEVKEYFFATLIGIIPFAVLLSYAGVLPFVYQMVAFVIGTIMIVIAMRFINSIRKNKS